MNTAFDLMNYLILIFYFCICIIDLHVIFQEAATREKLVLEDNQRALHRELKEKSEDWKPRLFEIDPLAGSPHAWVYKYRE